MLNRRLAALILLAGLVHLLSLPGMVIVRVEALRQVAEVPRVPVSVRADGQSASPYFVRVMDAVKGTGAV